MSIPTTAPPGALLRAAPEQANRREAILLAAEQLFAEHGFHAVSMRDIAAQAGVQVALVSYYYGSKQALYQAIFESWLPSIQQRKALLDHALEAPSGPTLEAVLHAFVDPLVVLNEDPQGRYFARMASRELTQPSVAATEAQQRFIDPMSLAFMAALQRLFPGAGQADVAWAYQFMLGAVVHFLAGVRVEQLTEGRERAADPARVPALVAFLAAGLEAVLKNLQPQGTAEPRRPARPAAARKG